MTKIIHIGYCHLQITQAHSAGYFEQTLIQVHTKLMKLWRDLWLGSAHQTTLHCFPNTSLASETPYLMLFLEIFIYLTQISPKLFYLIYQNRYTLSSRLYPIQETYPRGCTLWNLGIVQKQCQPNHVQKTACKFWEMEKLHWGHWTPRCMATTLLYSRQKLPGCRIRKKNQAKRIW